MTKPCATCGTAKRYENGRCVACKAKSGRAHYLAARAKNADHYAEERARNALVLNTHITVKRVNGELMRAVAGKLHDPGFVAALKKLVDQCA